MIDVVGNNMEHFLRCGPQHRKMFSVVGSKAEELPQCKTV
jgi:hypothetical protein